MRYNARPESEAPPRRPARFEGGGLSSFQLLGWVSDGKVRGQYGTTAAPGTASEEDDFEVDDSQNADEEKHCNIRQSTQFGITKRPVHRHALPNNGEGRPHQLLAGIKSGRYARRCSKRPLRYARK
jgi:hypothetical protein